MIRLTPALLVGTASAFIGFGEDPHGRIGKSGHKDNNGNYGSEDHSEHRRGVMIDPLLRRMRAHPRAPWDAALVYHAGYWSHFDHRANRSSWPVPPRRTAHALAAFARKANILDARPEAGDLFVLWSAARKRFVHAGIVLQVGERGEFLSGQAFTECVVLSPNVHPRGRIGGPDTLRLMRRICPERGDWFIRWTELDDGLGHEPGDNEIQEAA